MKFDIEYLNHIKDEIDFLNLKSNTLDRNEFLTDETIKRAFIRSIEIIGEAATKISDPFKSKYPEIEWKKLSATRNRLIHGYFVVDYDIVWDLIINKIPALEKQITFILEKERTLFD
ncbi:HepT-like ribonuclease domain-containing protein [Leptospira andrefontaineae]|uniref:DUF86 domain-containing protein n=1 Tax=Leptospira andrefontaineae TaxID=2484976 RepID=A0A4R9H2B9_9LEPT|nr:DUF86 domain-containing protein [Leptospira andrefontaineae]TGK38847.1 DUF86 domain-containing protein [Leptospira andrefontaineae]